MRPSVAYVPTDDQASSVRVPVRGLRCVPVRHGDEPIRTWGQPGRLVIEGRVWGSGEIRVAKGPAKPVG